MYGYDIYKKVGMVHFVNYVALQIRVIFDPVNVERRTWNMERKTYNMDDRN